MKYLVEILVGMVLMTQPCWGVGDDSRTLGAPEAPEGAVVARQVTACGDGVVLDDGTVETGYGWVPSVVWGEYVQVFPGEAVHTTLLERVCLPLTRTRADDTMEFEVVVYGTAGPGPSGGVKYSFPASASGVPVFPETAFYEIDLGDAAPVLAPSWVHIGIRWNPSVDQFFFVGADQDGPGEPVGGFFRDDRAGGEWGDVLNTSDPIFQDHRAMGVRIVTRQVAWIPVLGWPGRILMAGLLASIGWVALRRLGSA